MPNYAKSTVERVKADELTKEELVMLVQEIVDHLGREIEVHRWADGGSYILLQKPEH